MSETRKVLFVYHFSKVSLLFDHLQLWFQRLIQDQNMSSKLSMDAIGGAALKMKKLGKEKKQGRLIIEIIYIYYPRFEN